MKRTSAGAAGVAGPEVCPTPCVSITTTAIAANAASTAARASRRRAGCHPCVIESVSCRRPRRAARPYCAPAAVGHGRRAPRSPRGWTRLASCCRRASTARRSIPPACPAGSASITSPSRCRPASSRRTSRPGAASASARSIAKTCTAPTRCARCCWGPAITMRSARCSCSSRSPTRRRWRGRSRRAAAAAAWSTSPIASATRRRPSRRCGRRGSA